MEKLSADLFSVSQTSEQQKNWLTTADRAEEKVVNDHKRNLDQALEHNELYSAFDVMVTNLGDLVLFAKRSLKQILTNQHRKIN